MNNAPEHPNSESLKKLYADQLAEEGIKVDSSPSAQRQSENYQNDMAEEAELKSSSESEVQGYDNNYYNGMSQ